MEAIEWARANGADGEIEVVSDQAWARVTRIGDTWLKECMPVQAFEVPLALALAGRWPDRVPRVLAADVERAWLLLADAGTPMRAFGDVMDAWEAALPLYAELQQGETLHADEHLASGVSDRRPQTLVAEYAARAEREPRLLPHADRFAELCASLTRPPSIQHDDLHESNIYARDGRICFLDWGDACVAHPFATMYVACRVVEHFRGPQAMQRVRSIYLSCWDGDVRDELERVLPVAAFARMLQWDAIGDAEGVETHLEWFLEHVASS
jgi:hypothetical protein